MSAMIRGSRVVELTVDIVIMAPIEIRPIKAIRRLDRIFQRRLADRCVVDVQNPVIIDGRSEPQPAILLLRNEADARILTFDGVSREPSVISGAFRRATSKS